MVCQRTINVIIAAIDKHAIIHVITKIISYRFNDISISSKENKIDFILNDVAS